LKTALQLACALALGCSVVLAHAQPSPVGLWKTIDDDGKTVKSLVRITENGGTITGIVEKILDPEAPSDERCTNCKDERKGKPILGMTIIRNITHSSSDQAIWDGGEILDPKNGKTYRAQLKPVDAGRLLDVRGYIGIPWIGRTQTWIRIE